MRRDLTSAELLELLRERADELGRTPKVREVREWQQIFRRFGSWNKALVAAGLQPRQPFARDHLIELLQMKAQELGRPPQFDEMAEDPRLPSPHTYRNRFGGWRQALTAAGLGTDHLSKPKGTHASPLDAHLQRFYGMTEAEFWERSEAQGHLCEICGKPEVRIDNRSGKVNRLSVDHCHVTGKVRGLLCNRCNHLLGRVEDDIALLDAMAEYLRASGARLDLVTSVGK